MKVCLLSLSLYFESTLATYVNNQLVMSSTNPCDIETSVQGYFGSMTLDAWSAKCVISK